MPAFAMSARGATPRTPTVPAPPQPAPSPWQGPAFVTLARHQHQAPGRGPASVTFGKTPASGIRRRAVRRDTGRYVDRVTREYRGYRTVRARGVAEAAGRHGGRSRVLAVFVVNRGGGTHDSTESIA